MASIWIFNHDAMTPYNGTLTRHYSFTKNLIASGHEVIIFTSSVVHNTEINIISDKSLCKEQTIDGVRFVYVKTCPYRENGRLRIKNMLAFYFNLLRVARLFPKPDIIYSSSPQIFSLLAGVQVARKFKLPCVSEVRDLWPESIVEYNGISRRNILIIMLYVLERHIYRRSSTIIFTMEGMYDYIREKKWEKQVDEGKCHYINNGVDIEEFNSYIDKYVIDDPDLSNPDTFKVIYCGSIRTANSIDLLVDCAAELKNRKGTGNVIILVYGDGPYREELMQRCIDEKINNIIFKGFVEKKYIPYILSKSDLNILNYRASSTQKYGNSSNKLFEYLAAGHPVLANIYEGKYPIISKFNCGAVLVDRSAHGYADAILYFSEMDKERYSELCENAKKTAKMFDIPVLSSKLEEVLCDTITEFHN
jgi:glycosyltransferase involved in cell wall biosynthesis